MSEYTPEYPSARLDKKLGPEYISSRSGACSKGKIQFKSDWTVIVDGT